MKTPYLTFAFALDGLIRSQVSGDGGEEFARKNIQLIAKSLEEIIAPGRVTEVMPYRGDATAERGLRE